MMRFGQFLKYNILPLVCGFVLFVVGGNDHLTAQEYKALQTWEVYLPFNSATALAVGQDRVLVGTEQAMFFYDLEDNSIQTLTKVDGFSELSVAAIAYSEQHDIFIIGYENTNIDLIKNGKIINISDISRANIIGEKTIRRLHIDGDLVYIACSFGVVVLDIVEEEIRDTYTIGANGEKLSTFDVATSDNTIMVATAQGLFQGDLNDSDLADFNNWSLTDLPAGNNSSVAYANTFYATSDDVLYKLEETDWMPFYSSSEWFVQSINVAGTSLIIPEWRFVGTSFQGRRMVVIDEAGNTVKKFDNKLSRPIEGAFSPDGQLYVADARTGLVRIDWNGEGESVSILPNGPNSNRVFSLNVDRQGRLWVAPGSVTSSWNYQWNNEGFFVYEQGQWTNNNQDNVPLLDEVYDLIDVVQDPVENKNYIASYGEGIVEWVDEENVSLINSDNSTIQGGIGDSGKERISSLAFDFQGNLWATNFLAVEPISVKIRDGEWHSFTPNVNIGEERGLIDVLVDDFNQKWMIVKRNGILVMNHGSSIEDTSDDEYKLLKANVGLGNLPDNQVNCLIKDLDGAIWAGTEKGVGVFYCPGNVIGNGCDAIFPYVEVDGIGALLLKDESVRAMAVDGANRKWIGTSNGLWLMSEDGTEQLAYFTTRNSPLLSNSIISIAIDQNTGEVYIGTDRGIVSFRGEARGAANSHETIQVYPNPVRPNYQGEIAIDGLARDAYVKITDIAGTLIYETRALGGQAIWDGKDYNGRRASTGVYLIFSTNRSGLDHAVGKLLIVNE
ncbi:MAG: hypothetical protein ACPGXL_01480 [Chitinophagales bacterium]